MPVHIKLRRGNWAAYHSVAREIVIEGPARTGKTFGLLLRMNKHAQEVPGYRGLIVRKFAVTLGSTILRTLEEDVYHEWERVGRISKMDGVHFFGGSQNEPPAYVYANGSRIIVGGMDQPTKILGSEYDEILYNEIIEGSEEDVETLLSRLSHGLLANPAFMGDTNPSFDRHWVLQRIYRGGVDHQKTTLKDNPAFYDDAGEPTERGKSYLESIAGLTGTRYQRLVLGEWIGMENAIYPQLDPSAQLGSLPERVGWETGAIGIDYGRVHLSAVVAVTRDSTGIYWVREVWAESGGDPQKIEDMSRGMKVRYRISRGRVDPIQEFMAQKLAFKTASIAAGSRKARIGYVTRLLDAGALKFDADAPGVRDLFDEMLGYRYERRETDTNIDDVVVRKDDDRVAALEYAIEELTGQLFLELPARSEQTGRTQRRPQRASGWLGV